MTIRLFITDDHALVRAGLVSYLGMSADIEVVGEAANGAALLEALHSTAADLLLLDLVMPGICGAELIGTIRETHPGLRILVFSSHNETGEISRALKAGASAYIGKDCKPQALLEAIRKASTDEKYPSQEIGEPIAFPLKNSEPVSLDLSLSVRNMKTFRQIADGKSIRKPSKDIAAGDNGGHARKYTLPSKHGFKNCPASNAMQKQQSI